MRVSIERGLPTSRVFFVCGHGESCHRIQFLAPIQARCAPPYVEVPGHFAITMPGENEQPLPA